MGLAEDFDGVASRRQLRLVGIDSDRVAREARNGRWQVFGSAVVLHNGTPTPSERARVAMINCGPRAALTGLAALQVWGLRGWRRDCIDVLVPAGTRRPPIPDLRLHRVVDWPAADIARGRRLHKPAPAMVRAAGTCDPARTACGLLAAGVQQRLVTADELRQALHVATRTRHRAVLLQTVADLAQGADALSEIDFVKLCRQHGLPAPVRQAVRVEPGGRRRYLDAEWQLPDGRTVAVEVDGAFHLDPKRWIDDQLRQNWIVIGGTPVLRFPSIVIRTQPELVVAQLTRALAPTMMR